MSTEANSQQTHATLPLVSIVIPTYNRLHYVGDAIESCHAQSYPRCEILLVDDGSSDGTAEALRERYGDSIRLFTQRNQGPGIARNRGIDAAKGDFIHFLDADDQLHPQKIERCLQVFLRQPELAVIYTHYQCVAADGKTALPTPPFESFSRDIFCEMLRWAGCRILLSSSMVRASALRRVGTFAHDREFRSAEDWDLFLRLAARYRFFGIDERLVYRRMHGSMLSDNRYYGILGRLKTVENARNYGWQRCMDAAEFARLEAARHHVMALHFWAGGQRRNARQHLRKAIALCPRDARMRRVFWLYSWLLPAAVADWTSSAMRYLRRISTRR